MDTLIAVAETFAALYFGIGFIWAFFIYVMLVADGYVYLLEVFREIFIWPRTLYRIIRGGRGA